MSGSAATAARSRDPGLREDRVLPPFLGKYQMINVAFGQRRRDEVLIKAGELSQWRLKKKHLSGVTSVLTVIRSANTAGVK